MPIERLRMRPWLEDALNSRTFPGVEWLDKDRKIFKLPWKHASRNGWQINKDASLFQAWAKHTGKYKNNEQPNPKTWKANFRCALNSLPDMEELVDRRTTKGNDAFKVYRIICNMEKKCYSKKLKARSKSKKRSFSRARSVQKETKFEQNTIKPDAEQRDTSANSRLDLGTNCEFPPEVTAHLVDHDYTGTQYLNLFADATDDDMKDVFEVPENEVIKREPLSPANIHENEEFSLYEESKVDSQNIKTSCIEREERILSDNEVVDMIDEMSSDCGSTTESVDRITMEELFEDCVDTLTDFPDIKQRSNSAPGSLSAQGSLDEVDPLDYFCIQPSKIPRTKSSPDIQTMLNTTSQGLLQSCLSSSH